VRNGVKTAKVSKKGKKTPNTQKKKKQKHTEDSKWFVEGKKGSVTLILSS